MIAKLFVIIGVVVAAPAVNQGDDDSLTKERKELTEERKEITEIFRRETDRQEDDQLRAKMDKLQGQNDKRDKKQQEQITKLQKENQKLRRANSKINKVVRQRDQNVTQEFDNMIRNSSELKKMMREEINNFLINEKICVGGLLDHISGAWNVKQTTVTVDFGHAFPRKPMVLVLVLVLVLVSIYGSTRRRPRS